MRVRRLPLRPRRDPYVERSGGLPRPTAIRIRFAARALLLALLIGLLGVGGGPAALAALAALPAYLLSALLHRGGRSYETALVVGDALLLFAALHGAPPGVGIEALAPIWLIGSAFATLRHAELRRLPPLLLAAEGALLTHALLAATGPAWLLVQTGLVLAAGAVAASLVAERGENRRDPLTGVLTRGAGIAELSRRLARAEPEAAPGVAFVDLVGFKAINDRHGHPVGDELLRLVGARLAGAVRSGDIVFRYGGDEFVVVGRSADLAERLHDALRTPFGTSAGPLRVGARVGLLASEAGADVATVLAEADRRMYSEGRRAAAG